MECSICLGEITKPTTLDCGHIFCRTCIKSWSHLSLECPYCRQYMSLRAILDNELSEGYNIVQFGGHMHRIMVEDVELDNGEKVQIIIKHQFRGMCGRDTCHFCSFTWNMARVVLKYDIETPY